MVDKPKEDISDCKGLRGVAMATKFWPKYAKNHKNGYNFSFMQHIHAEFGFEIGFVLSRNSSVTLRTQGTKGHYHGNQFVSQNRQKYHKMVQTSVVCVIFI